MISSSDFLKQVSAMQDTTEAFLAQLNQFHQSLETQSLLASASAFPFLHSLMIFVLAIFVGYYVVWRVTPALHAPLMSVTNAISSVIIVGALLACGALESEGPSRWLGFFGVVLASVNIFGGFFITHRMLRMFRQRKLASSQAPHL
ncbi:MAG: NAD(P) transhydrogenase subunit alpha [Alphaproteobacteria bacterium]